MNPEERLSDALHSVVDPARPSPDLADRIVERVSVAGRRQILGGNVFGNSPFDQIVFKVVINRSDDAHEDV